MNAGMASERGAVADLNVPAQQNVVNQGNLVADRAVVGHVTADQQEALLADNGRGIGRGSPMDGDIFPQDGSTPDATSGRLTAIFQILRLMADDQRVEGQGLYDEESLIGARERGEFDTALEEIWHMVTDNGLSVAYPDVFDRVPGTEVANAMDLARGGRFERPPAEYPEGAWYTYYDETCDYDCQTSEYIYWTFTSFIGAQDLPGRLDAVGHEWPLTTRQLLLEGDPVMFEILSRPEYRLPSIPPDGNYTGTPLTIEAYEHQ